MGLCSAGGFACSRYRALTNFAPTYCSTPTTPTMPGGKITRLAAHTLHTPPPPLPSPLPFFTAFSTHRRYAACAHTHTHHTAFTTFHLPRTPFTHSDTAPHPHTPHIYHTTHTCAARTPALPARLLRTYRVALPATYLLSPLPPSDGLDFVYG